MEQLIADLQNLVTSYVKKMVDSRIHEFKQLGKHDMEQIFQELCFCVLTANCSAERCIMIQDSVNDGFLRLTESELSSRFRSLGYRFPNTRARYISESRKHLADLALILSTYSGTHLRDQLINTFLGLGYKEASHFLRNIGYDDYAIIDFHIIDLLERYGAISKSKTLTKKQYLIIENKLRSIADTIDIPLSKLDLYLWYLETGKVLK